MFDIQSIVIYLGLAILSFGIAKYAELLKSRRAVWLIVVMLSFIAGLRAPSVGIDTKVYDGVFQFISSGNIKSIYGLEKSFIYICTVLLKIWENNHFLFFIFAFITHGLVLFRLWKDREYISFRWSVFSYYILFFAFSLNGMRQFIAVAIVFYATSFIKEGKYVKFTALTLVASLFHTSAIVGLAYFFFEIIFVRFFDKKRKMVVFLLVAIGGIVGFSIILNLLKRYSGYFEQRSSSFGFMMLVKLAMLFASVIVLEKPSNKNQKYYYLSHRWNYFVGLLLNSLNYIFMYMGRIGLYFYVFEAIYIGYLFKAKNRTEWIVLLKLGYALLLLYYLYDNISRGTQGEIPYRFFWQN